MFVELKLDLSTDLDEELHLVMMSGLAWEGNGLFLIAVAGVSGSFGTIFSYFWRSWSLNGVGVARFGEPRSFCFLSELGLGLLWEDSLRLPSWSELECLRTDEEYIADIFWLLSKKACFVVLFCSAKDFRGSGGYFPEFLSLLIWKLVSSAALTWYKCW